MVMKNGLKMENADDLGIKLEEQLKMIKTYPWLKNPEDSKATTKATRGDVLKLGRFQSMLLVPNNLSQHFLSLLDKCCHLRHLQQLQAFVVTLGFTHNHFFAFKLVRFCHLSLANLSYARFIFDHLDSPNVFLYTALITAYASHPDHYQSALLLYRDMIRAGNPQPNHFIYPHVLKSCPDVLDSLGIKLVHSQILRSGFGGYLVVQTALVDSYSRINVEVGTARQMFDEMSEKNVVSWTAMISGYARLGEIDTALLLFDKMPERDVPAWNAVITGCAQNGLFSKAILVFRRMILLDQEEKRRKNKPNQVTIACVLAACAHTGMLQLGKWTHGYVYKIGLVLNSFLSSSLIDMYGKCGGLKVARKVFDLTSDRSSISWNSMINCYALHGQSENSINVFEEMIQSTDGVRPDEVTFVGLLSACAHGGLLERGYKYFKSMRDYGVEPQIEHYGCMIDILGRAGQFEEALEVVRGMTMKPDEVVWGSLLNGCKIHGRMDLAEIAVKKLIEIDPENGGYGIMLANIYVELGKWEEVGKMRETLKEHKAYKIPGCSWIEIDNKVYQFFYLDRDHPRKEDIYRVMESLSGFVAMK